MWQNLLGIASEGARTEDHAIPRSPPKKKIEIQSSGLSALPGHAMGRPALKLGWMWICARARGESLTGEGSRREGSLKWYT
jgi:hypothetical protein